LKTTGHLCFQVSQQKWVSKTVNCHLNDELEKERSDKDENVVKKFHQRSKEKFPPERLNQSRKGASLEKNK
jgi:hypothetical protein